MSKPRSSITNFGGQKYLKLKQDCLDTRSLFKDSEFPTNNKSIFFSKKDTEFKWMRPKELSRDARIVHPNAELYGSIVEGEFKCSWIVPVFSILARESKYLSSVIPDLQTQEYLEKNTYVGILRFHFWRMGKWREVVIDDLLPTREGQLMFCQSKHPDQFWPALVQKAYAKLNGTYESTAGLHLTDVLVDFTCGVPAVIDLMPYRTRDRLTLHADMKRYLDQSAVCVATAQSTNETRDRMREYGLVDSRVYVVITLESARIVDAPESPVPLVQLHNPHGLDEWRGPWSETSDTWPKLVPDEDFRLRRFTRDPHQGYFWLSLDDLVQFFSVLDLQHFLPGASTPRQSEVVFYGSWGRTEVSCNGGDEDSPTCLDNPQYRFDVKKNPLDTVTAVLEQDIDAENKSLRETIPEIGIIIIKVEDNRRYRVHRRANKTVGDVKVVSVYRKARNVFLKTSLNMGRYIVLPVCKEPDKKKGRTNTDTDTSKYVLKIYTTLGAHAHELQQNHPVTKCCGSNYQVVTFLKIESIKDVDPMFYSQNQDLYVYVSCEESVFTGSTVKCQYVTDFNIDLIFYRQAPKTAPICIEIYTGSSNVLSDSHGNLRSYQVDSIEISESGGKDTPKRLKFDVMNKSPDGSKKTIGKMVVYLQTKKNLKSF